MKKLLAVLTLLLTGCSLPMWSPKQTQNSEPSPTLRSMSANPTSVTVSGLSSGAFMAVQLHAAYSSTIMGVGAIAGGPWGCAHGSVIDAQIQCMDLTDEINAQNLAQDLHAAASTGLVDSVDHLSSARVYLFNSPTDRTVRAPINQKTVEFYSQFVSSPRIKTETSVSSAHGFPTLAFGNACDDMRSPYLNACQFDGAGELLKFIYQDRNVPMAKSAADPSSLRKFDQKEFATSDSQLADSGWVYTPKACLVPNSNCALHVALHGCKQSSEDVNDTFAVHAGYNDWAEGSQIIVLYPQAKSGPGNPNGCWDWFGYTGPKYATKNGVQMKAIKSMIDRLIMPTGQAD